MGGVQNVAMLKIDWLKLPAWPKLEASRHTFALTHANVVQLGGKLIEFFIIFLKKYIYMIVSIVWLVWSFFFQ